MSIEYFRYRNISDVINWARNGNTIDDNRLILTATNSMRKALSRQESLNEYPIISFSSLLYAIAPGWYHTGSKLDQMLELGNVLRELRSNGEISEEEYKSLVFNRPDILEATRILTEIGIYSSKLSYKKFANNREVLLFRKVFKMLETHWSFAQIRKRLRKFDIDLLYNGLDKVIQKGASEDSQQDFDLKDVFKKWQGKNIREIETVYLIGFYYMTPAQLSMAEAFRDLGLKVVYLNNTDESLPECFEIWENNPIFKDVKYKDIPPASRSDFNAKSLFVGNFEKEPLKYKPEIKRYYDIFSMVMDFDESKDEGMVYGPNGNDLDNFFHTFFPEDEEKQSLQAYPAGQYLFQLYQMWNENERKLSFSADDVHQCLATGWAGHGVEDSRLYLEKYERIKLFFSDCNEIYEWKERLELLKKIRSEIMPLFNVDEELAHQRWHKIMRSPFSYIGAFDLDEEDIEGLSGIIEDILSDAKELFGSSGNEDIAKHFAKVEKLLKVWSVNRKTTNEEIEAAEKMLTILRIQRANMKEYKREISCANGDIAEAMSFFLRGKLKSHEEQEVEDNKDKRHLGISDIEAELLSSESDKVRLCFCDDVHMPGGSGAYPWPLSRRIIENATLQSDKDKGARTRRRSYIYKIESHTLENRYLFFLSLQLKNLEISWTTHIGDAVYEKSPYIQILEKRYGLETDNYYAEATYNGKTIKGNLFNPKAVKINDYGENDMPMELILGDRMCKSGYMNLYAYALREKPLITSDFHLNFYSSSLLNAMKRRCGHENVDEEMFKLFPMWNETQRGYIKSFSDRVKNDFIDSLNFSEMDGISYPIKRLMLSSMPSSIRKLILEGGKVELDSCIYCTEKDVCTFRAGINLEDVDD